jgi:hypothetical protein
MARLQSDLRSPRKIYARSCKPLFPAYEVNAPEFERGLLNLSILDLTVLA